MTQHEMIDIPNNSWWIIDGTEWIPKMVNGYCMLFIISMFSQLNESKDVNGYYMSIYLQIWPFLLHVWCITAILDGVILANKSQMTGFHRIRWPAQETMKLYVCVIVPDDSTRRKPYRNHMRYWKWKWLMTLVANVNYITANNEEEGSLYILTSWFDNLSSVLLNSYM